MPNRLYALPAALFPQEKPALRSSHQISAQMRLLVSLLRKQTGKKYLFEHNIDKVHILVLPVFAIFVTLQPAMSLS